MEGLTDDNKDSVCASVASALGGVWTYCSMTPQSNRIRVRQDSTLYIDVSVADANAAVMQASSRDFISSLTGLPHGTTVAGVTTSDTLRGNN